MLIDIHIHFDDSRYDSDRDQFIERAKKAGVKKIVTAGVDHESNLKALELAKKYDIVECSLGRYPEGCLDDDPHYNKNKKTSLEQDIAFIKENKNQIIAIGEVGLDLYTGTQDSLPNQIITFKAMINLAHELDIPIVIHSRKAEKETIETLKESNIDPEKVILHCFSGKKQLIKEAIEAKYNFSIPTNTVRAENFQGLVKMCPLKQLLTETDGPYLSPYKNEDGSFNRNESSFVKETIKVIAEIKGLTEEDCANQIFMNYQRIF